MNGPKVAKPTRAEEASAYELVTLRDSNTCQRCRRDCGPIARDHRRNRSQGGLTVVSNLQLLGLGCHQWATEHPRLALEEGWAVPSYGDPALWPARRWFKVGAVMTECWVLYTDDGHIERISDPVAYMLMGRTS